MRALSPEGTAEPGCLSRPFGTHSSRTSNPALKLKRRAILICPFGTPRASLASNPSGIRRPRLRVRAVSRRQEWARIPFSKHALDPRGVPVCRLLGWGYGASLAPAGQPRGAVDGVENLLRALYNERSIGRLGTPQLGIDFALQCLQGVHRGNEFSEIKISTGCFQT